MPLLDRMYKEYEKGTAPQILESLATLYRTADAFVVVTGEYNHSIPPALSNLLDHFLEEYFFRPSAIVCYSSGAFGGVRAAMQLRAMLCELGMPSISSLFPIPSIQTAFDDDGTPRDASASSGDSPGSRPSWNGTPRRFARLGNEEYRIDDVQGRFAQERRSTRTRLAPPQRQQRDDFKSPRQLFETMGSVRTSDDPVRRNRPDRRSWSTDCLMAGRRGARCASSMVARSRPSGAHDGDPTIPASFAAVKSGGGIVMIRVREGRASCRRLRCATHCTICSKSACFAECRRSQKTVTRLGAAVC